MNTPAGTQATYSIQRRLALRISAQATLVMALMALLVYAAVQYVVDQRQLAELGKKREVVHGIFLEGVRTSGLDKAVADVRDSAYRRPLTRLTVRDPAGRVLYEDPDEAPFVMSPHPLVDSRSLDLGAQGLAPVTLQLQADTAHDRELLGALALTLLAVPLLGGLLVGLSSTWRIRRDLRPLKLLAEQTQRIGAQRLDQRLSLPEVATELLPWVTQFNGLMDRLQAAMDQLEAFNADVAHELRTPLASLMGHTEVALSRERSAAELREVMAASLEDLQQISAMVQDMLFLSRTDRGGRARASPIPSLHGLAAQVLEFHRYAIEDAGLQAQILGDAPLQADAPLLQRALFNLIDNAVQHAEANSLLELRIDTDAADRVLLSVRNRGAAIGAADLPRIFDRFFRADVSRADSGQRHGLGLAIVAGIARMHGGEAFARCADGWTTVGLALPRTPAS